MLMRIYLLVWVVISGYLAFEYWALNFHPELSSLILLQAKGLIDFKVSPDPGRPLSLVLGWIGLSLMIVMNVYSLRKRFQFMSGLGRMAAWLNFHVFCGLLGPTFILFHCNFKVRGLVAISFWSMVVSFSSGIIGRYFYIQLVGKKVEFEKMSLAWVEKLKGALEKFKLPFDEELAKPYFDQALALAGANAQVKNPLQAFFLSFAGDIRLTYKTPATPQAWPAITAEALKYYALNKRRAQFLESFQKLMGYWHTFHFPFAVFMYLAAIIHVAAALVFGIK